MMTTTNTTYQPTPEEIEQTMFYFDFADEQWDELDAYHRRKLIAAVNERAELLAGLRDMVDLLDSQTGRNRFADTAKDLGSDLLARAEEAHP